MDTPAANNDRRDLAPPQTMQTTQTTQTTPPEKPSLRLKLRLDAPKITDVKIGEFLTETLPSLRLDFTKVGASYNFRLDLAAALRQKAGEQAEFEFQLLEVDAEFERLGLRCALEQNVLAFEGTPKEKFDGFVALQINFACVKKIKFPTNSATSGYVVIEAPKLLRSDIKCEGAPVPLQFVIHPDPWSLWATREPSSDAPYPAAHDAIFADSFPRTDKLVLAASQRGRSHEHDGKFRDDSFAGRLYLVSPRALGFCKSKNSRYAQFNDRSRDAARLDGRTPKQPGASPIHRRFARS